jgi:hypothetical protein
MERGDREQHLWFGEVEELPSQCSIDLKYACNTEKMIFCTSQRMKKILPHETTFFLLGEWAEELSKSSHEH